MDQAPSSRWRLQAGLALALGLPIGLAIVYHFPPSENSYYPKCILFLLTGLHCSGCGMTRALHALMHGDWRQAFAYNLLFVAFLPLVVVYLAHLVAYVVLGRPLLKWSWPRWAIWAFVAIYLVFGIVRNVPVAPLDALAPHVVEPGEPVPGQE